MKNLKFFAQILSFLRGEGGFSSKDDKDPFFCFGLNILKKNGEGLQKENTLKNFSQYKICLK